MKLTKDALCSISAFMDQSDKKVLLIVGDGANHEVIGFIANKANTSKSAMICINSSQQENINAVLQNIPLSKPTVLVFDHGRLENYFDKYNINRWQAKVIILCKLQLLHPTLDASIYFAPIKNGQIQRQLFSALVLQDAVKSIQKQSLQVNLETKQEPSIKNQILDSLSNHFLNRQLFTNNIAMMQMLADRVLVDDAFQAFLFQLLLASRQDDGLRIAAANAITVLNTARVSFAGLDLSGIKIPDANLRNAIFHYTNLAGADLSRVDLRQAYLCHANLTDSQMKNVKFGELPYANLGGNHFLHVHLLSVANNGRYLAVALGTAILLFDLITGTEQFFPERNTQLLMSIQFSLDSKMMIGCSYDSIQLWEVKTRESIGAVLRNENASFNCASFSYDGTMFANGDIDGVIRLWETKAQKMVGEPLLGHTSTICSIAFSPNNYLLASGSMDHTIRIWHLQKRTLFGQPLIGHPSGVLSIVFHPKIHFLLVSGGQDGKIYFWDVARSILLDRPLVGHTSSINSVAFSLDGKLLASGSNDRSVRLWDVENKVSLGRPFLGHQDRANAVAFSVDGKVLYSVGCGDQTIRRWVIEDAPTENRTPALHSNNINSIALSPDSKFIATGSWDESVQMLSVKTRQLICSRLIGTAFLGVRSVVFSSNANIFVSAGEIINIWSAHNYPDYKYTKELLYYGHSVQTIALSPNNTLLASGGFDKTIRLWDLVTYQVLEPPFVGHDEQVTTVAFNKNGMLLASGSYDSTVRLWNVTNRTLIKVWIATTVFAPNGSPVIPKYNSPQTPKDLVNSIAFSPNDVFLAAGCSDSMIWLWKVNGNTQDSQKFIGHTKPVTCICFHSQGDILASGSMDYTIRLWQVSTLQCIAVYLSLENVRSICLSPDGDYLCVANGSDIVMWKRCLHAAYRDEYLLHWYTGAARLNVQQMCLQSARGLTNDDVSLLAQLGAVKAEVDAHTINDAAEKKIIDCDLVLKFTPDDDVLYCIRGNAKYALNQFDEALKDYDIATALNSSNADYFNNRATCKRSLNRHLEAICDYDLAIMLNPHKAAFYEFRGNMRYLLKQFEQAHLDYDYAFSLEGSSVCLFKKAIIYLFQNNLIDASFCCNQILMLNSRDEIIPRLKLYARITLNFIQWIDNKTSIFVGKLMEELLTNLTTTARVLSIVCEYLIEFYLHAVELKGRQVEFQSKLKSAYKEMLAVMQHVERICTNEPFFYFYYGRLLLVGGYHLMARQAFFACNTLAPGFFSIIDWITKCDSPVEAQISSSSEYPSHMPVAYASNNLAGYNQYGLLKPVSDKTKTNEQDAPQSVSSMKFSFN